jgi:hypothetical protein
MAEHGAVMDEDDFYEFRYHAPALWPYGPWSLQAPGEVFGRLAQRSRPGRVPGDPRQSELGALPPPVRALLLRHGYWTLDQLAAASDRELLAVRNLGKRRLAIVRQHAPVQRGR